MKPLGTITMCFPHVDDETRNALKSVMKDAENYTDFSKRLCERVCSETSPILLEYLAFFFSFHISEYNNLDDLVNAGKVPDLAKPLLLVVKYRRGESIDWDQMKQSLKKAIKLAPNDWIAIQLYLKWRYYAEHNFPDCDIESKLIQTITNRVDTDKEFEFFGSYLLRFKAIRANFDSHFQDAVELLNQALLLARKCDEQVVIADVLSGLADNLKSDPAPHIKKHLNLKGKGREPIIQLMNASRNLSEQLGYRYRIGYVQQNVGNFNGARGELNFAIENILEFHRIRESLGISVSITNTMLAFYYNQMGAGDEALKRVDAAIHSKDPLRRLSSWALTQRAWALINLGRHDEARADLEISKDLVSKSGVAIWWFVWYQIVEGILYKVERNFEAATTTLEDALNYLEGNPFGVVDNICLLNLTEIEIELFDKESLDKPSDTSGPWMEKLEESARVNNRPGAAAQSLILKAKFLQRQGRYDEMKMMLKRVQKVAFESGMTFLNEMVKSSFPDVILA
ncbi:MAG: hypothetical protein ACW992_01310 [Candidatus Thorarchaeota archaeon]